ncbi:N-acetyltransferase family protein [Streptomyces sp. NPDC002004]
MTAADCEAVAEIRVRGWQSAYTGLMPQRYLDALDVARDAERRRELLARSDDSVVDLVAVRVPPGTPGRGRSDGEVVGWSCHGPSRDADAPAGAAELYALYVRTDAMSTGVGTALLGEALRRCATAGHGTVQLWVLRDNVRARRFYEKAGFTPDGAEEPFVVGGTAVPEVRYTRSLARP